jgi:hypothetical protein
MAKGLERRIDSLIQEGSSNTETVAMMGGSVDLVRKLRQTEQVPSLSRGRSTRSNTYDLVPIFYRIRRVNSRLAEEIRENYDAPEELTGKHARETAKMYALEDAITDGFLDHTGLLVPDVATVYYLAHDLVTDHYNTFLLDTAGYNYFAQDQEALNTEVDRDTTFAVQETLEPQQLKAAVKETLNRRGVIFCFNETIFDGTETSSVDDWGIRVVSPQPFSIDTLSGIELLSEADREASLKR